MKQETKSKSKSKLAKGAAAKGADNAGEVRRFTNIVWTGEDAENPQLVKALLRRSGYKDLNNQKEAVKIAVGIVVDLLSEDPDFLTNRKKPKTKADPDSQDNGDALY
jgi:hypothetical protein